MSTKKTKILITIFSFALSLMFLGLCGITYANSTDAYLGEWNINYTNIETNKNAENVIVNTDKITFLATLDDLNDVFVLRFKVNNDGVFDASLSDIKKTDLTKYLVGTSADNQEYYLSDYLIYDIRYAKNNTLNDVVVDDLLNNGNQLKSKSSNEIVVKIKYKSDLTDDQKQIIMDNYASGLASEFDLTLVYLQAN